MRLYCCLYCACSLQQVPLSAIETSRFQLRQLPTTYSIHGHLLHRLTVNGIRSITVLHTLCTSFSASNNSVHRCRHAQQLISLHSSQHDSLQSSSQHLRPSATCLLHCNITFLALSFATLILLKPPCLGIDLFTAPGNIMD